MHYLFLTLLLFALPTLLKADAMTQIVSYQNEAVKEVRPILDEWGIALYRQYPYLYVYQEETDYNTIFEIDPEAFVLFAERDGKKVGVLQANFLNSPYLEHELYTPFSSLDQIRKNGFDPDKILYISCFLMTKEERLNLDTVAALFQDAVSRAKKMGKTQICYMEIVQDPQHPLKPDPYITLEPWDDVGIAFKSMDVQWKMNWPTLQPDGTVVDEAHTMALYIMDIQEKS